MRKEIPKYLSNNSFHSTNVFVVFFPFFTRERENMTHFPKDIKIVSNSKWLLLNSISDFFLYVSIHRVKHKTLHFIILLFLHDRVVSVWCISTFSVRRERSSSGATSCRNRIALMEDYPLSDKVRGMGKLVSRQTRDWRLIGLNTQYIIQTLDPISRNPWVVSGGTTKLFQESRPYLFNYVVLLRLLLF